jgi:uncharacterized protein involved in response to NO
MNKLWSLVKSEPYRIFFPLGWLAGLIGVTYWLLISTQIISSYNPLFHGLIQIELFALAFAVGFLLTALPKFLRTPTTTNLEFLSFLVNYFVLAIALLTNSNKLSQFLFIAILLQILRFAILRFKQRKASPPDSFLLVAFGLLQGVLGSLTLLAPCPIFPMLGQKLIEQGMFLSLSLGIGTFLGPRLMGLVDVTNAIVNTPGAGRKALPWHEDPRLAVFSYGVLIASSFLIETGINRDLGIFIRAITTTICLYHFGVLKFPRSPSIVAVLVGMSLWTMASGLWLAAFVPLHEIGALHLTYIGGFALLIFAIGAQVISSHGGYPGLWSEHKAWAKLTLILVASSAVLRAIASLFPSYYFSFLAISAICLDIAFLLWGLKLFKHLLRPGSKA